MQLFRFKKETQNSRQRQPSLTDRETYSFRRSRTLTGSISSQVATVAEGRSQLQSPRLKTHQLHKHRRNILLLLTVSIVTATWLSWLVGQFIIMPKDFTYNQILNGRPATQDYAKTIEAYFNEHPTQRFLFGLEDESLVQYVSKQHTEVESITINKISPSDFDVGVTLRQPVLSWYAGDMQLYVDDSGAPFSNNYFTEPRVVVDDQSGIQLNGNNTVASTRFVEFLGRIVSGVNQSDLKVDKVIIPTGTTREVDLLLEKRPFIVKTHIDRNPNAQAQDVVNAVRHLEGKGITAPEYIDARVAGKAYYR